MELERGVTAAVSQAVDNQRGQSLRVRGLRSSSDPSDRRRLACLGTRHIAFRQRLQSLRRLQGAHRLQATSCDLPDLDDLAPPAVGQQFVSCQSPPPRGWQQWSRLLVSMRQRYFREIVGTKANLPPPLSVMVRRTPMTIKAPIAAGQTWSAVGSASFM